MVVAGFVASLKLSGGAEEGGAENAILATPQEQAILLIAKGVAHLKNTTISYPNWRDRIYKPGVRETTEWFLAFAAFDEASAVLAEEPPPTTTEPPPDSQPVANFSYSPATPVEAQPVMFDGSASVCGDAPCSYVWQDDGPDGPGGTQWPLGSGQQLQFTFNGCPCTIFARLRVTDADGDMDSVMRQIQVSDSSPPPATTAPPPTTTAPPPTQTGKANVWVARP